MKILLVCDSVHYRYSGGRVARYVNSILKKDNDVKIVVISEMPADMERDEFYKDNEVIFIPQRDKKIYTISNFLYKTKGLTQFKNILDIFVPEVVHFASFDNDKPAEFILEANKSGAKVILQPWTMDFYCARKYGFMNNEQCTLCANGNFLYALKNKCISYKLIFGLYKRAKLKKASKKADLFLSSNSDLDQILFKYNVNKEKIFRFPIPFDYTAIHSNKNLETKDYFIFYGLPAQFKGLDLLVDIFINYVNENLRIYPTTNLELSNNSNGRIQIFNNFSWENGLKEAIIESKAVLVPSLWSTSTEYSLCEAIILKKPVILFNVGIHKDIFVNRFNALVVEPYDLRSFADAVSELANNQELRDSLSENAYKTILDINNPDNIKSLLLQAYNIDKF